jgi:hypothetical protein
MGDNFTPGVKIRPLGWPQHHTYYVENFKLESKPLSRQTDLILIFIIF